MTRDPDLMRDILLQIEKMAKGRDEDIVLYFEHVDTLVLNEHVRLLAEGGYLDVRQGHDIDDEDIKLYIPIRLTNDGHDFIDAVRSNTIWAKAKSKATEAGTFTLKLLVQAAFEYAKIELSK
jgi:Hypothetical protein (DUF2513)